MTKREAEKLFCEDILPGVKEQYEQDGIRDLPARCEAWNNWTDMLCKEGQITEKQYMHWRQPKCCS